MAGDFGFDPLRLGKSDNLPYYKEAELMNGRWAMTAMTGIFFTEAIGKPVWFEAGAESYALDFTTLAVLQVVVMGIFEFKRWEGFQKTGSSGLLASYPFDPLGYKSPAFEKAEVMNGRIAMLAFAGTVAVGGVYGKGPVACLADHIKDPGHVNVYTTAYGPMFIGIIFLLNAWPFMIEAQKAFTAGAPRQDNSFLSPTPFTLDDSPPSPLPAEKTTM